MAGLIAAALEPPKENPAKGLGASPALVTGTAVFATVAAGLADVLVVEVVAVIWGRNK